MQQHLKPLTHGGIVFPGEWEVHSDVVLVMPAKAALSAPLTGKSTVGSNSSIVISQRPAVDMDAARRLEGIVREIGAQVPRLKYQQAEAFVFLDNSKAATVMIEFEANPGMVLLQQHILRVDNHLETHIACTVNVGNRADLNELLNVVRTYVADISTAG
ncbi:MAG: hypothetical protein R3C68_04765 [Myxococcota bacterium]